MKKLIFILIIFNLLSAADNAGDFLNNDKVARAQGLGNAFSAIADDSSAVFYNPAGLAKQNISEILFQNTDFWGVNYLVLSSKFKWHNEKIGFAILNGNIGGIKESKLDINGDPYFTGKTFSWTGRAVYLSWAKDLNVPEIKITPNNLVTTINSASSENIPEVSAELKTAIENETKIDAVDPVLNLGTIGFSLKIINEQLYDSQAYGYGLDLGYIYTFSAKLNLAFVIENILKPQLTWNTENQTKEFVPANIKLGSAYKFSDQLILVTELTKKDNRDAQLQGGAEYWLFKQADFAFAIRGGLEPKTGSLGLTVKLDSFNIDYAFTNSEYSEDLGQTHKIAVGYRL